MLSNQTGPQVHIVFVAYNCAEAIYKVILQLQEGMYPVEKLKIIVVDNNSLDDLTGFMGRLNGIEVTILKNKFNLGFGAACNRVLECIEDDGYILFLNPDITLNRNSIANLMDFALSNPYAGIWGGKTVRSDASYDGQSAWREPSLTGLVCWAILGDILLKRLRLTLPDAYSERQLRKNCNVDVVSGCFFMIDAGLFRQLGGFDTRYFMYSEEVDLCRRARELGAVPKIALNATLKHEGSVTVSGAKKIEYYFDSKIQYIQKFWPKSKFHLGHAVIFLGATIRFAAFYCAGLVKHKYLSMARRWFGLARRQIKSDRMVRVYE